MKPQKRAAILRVITEGGTIRGTARAFNSSHVTVGRLVHDAGNCAAYFLTQALYDLRCSRIQIDEVWGFVQKKRRGTDIDGRGQTWAYLALCQDTKLVICHTTGPRTPETTHRFCHDLRARVEGHPQVTSDGNALYRTAIPAAFGRKIDYGMLVKTYDSTSRHVDAPPSFTGHVIQVVIGSPIMADVTTNHIEVFNSGLRGRSARFARRARGFSKSPEHHASALALHVFVHNFCRSHHTLTKARGGVHCTPAMAAGLTTRVWPIEDLVMAINPDYASIGNVLRLDRPQAVVVAGVA